MACWITRAGGSSPRCGDETTLDVLDDHHGIIYDEPYRHGETAQRHEIERITEEAKPGEGSEDGEGKRQGSGDGSDHRLMEKEQQHNHREDTAHNHRVPYVANG